MKDYIINKITFFRKLNLIQKFLLTYCILILVPLTALFGYSYAKMSNIIESNLLNSTEKAFEQSVDFITYKLYRIFDISNTLAIDENIVTILRNDPDNYLLSDQISHLSYLRLFLSSYEDESEVSNVSLYVNDNFIYKNDNKNIFSMNILDGTKAINLINSTNARFIWGPSSYFTTYNPLPSDTLSLFKTIKSPDNFAENIGYLKLTFKKSLISDIINKINSVPNTVSYIINSEGIIICSSEEKNQNIEYITDINQIQDFANINNKFSTTKVNNSKIYVKSSLIDKTDWYLVTLLPESSIIAAINSQRIYLFIIVVICGGTSIALAFYFIKYINKRLNKVVKGMRCVQSGDFSHYIDHNDNDELGELIDSYNYMIGKMSILIDEQYKLGKSVKNAELKALQSQINPHFLYNTLDMINWMSYKKMNSEISHAVKNLAKFYKLSLNKGKDLVPIKDELQHATLFVNIKNMRYNNRISLKFNVDEAINDYLIPKITLQPIIENSINYGILGKGEGTGTISILGYSINSDVILTISDDGIGMTEDKLKELIDNKLTSSKGSGYGLKNINKRIKLLYGDNYGLSFKSVYNYGTTVIIKIPPIKEIEKND